MFTFTLSDGPTYNIKPGPLLLVATSHVHVYNSHLNLKFMPTLSHIWFKKRNTTRLFLTQQSATSWNCVIIYVCSLTLGDRERRRGKGGVGFLSSFACLCSWNSWNRK